MMNIKCRVGMHKWKDLSTASDIEKQIMIDGEGGIWVRHSCERCGHALMDHAPMEFEMGFNMGRQYGKPIEYALTPDERMQRSADDMKARMKAIGMEGFPNEDKTPKPTPQDQIPPHRIKLMQLK